jgi:hypothetical protein
VLSFMLNQHSFGWPVAPPRQALSLLEGVRERLTYPEPSRRPLRVRDRMANERTREGLELPELGSRAYKVFRNAIRSCLFSGVSCNPN